MTQPFLFYHDEISVGTNATSGVLTCMVESSIPVWRDVSASPVDTSSPLQSITSGLMSRLSRTGAIIPNDPINIMDCGVVYTQIEQHLVI